jgi:2-methylcitrate dehydratase PrpD
MDSEELVLRSFDDPDIQALSKKITITRDDEVEQYMSQNPTHFCATKVIIWTCDGKAYERWVTVPLGDVETPLGWEMPKSKFDNMVAGTPCEKTKVERFNLLKNLEKTYDICMLFQLSVA